MKRTTCLAVLLLLASYCFGAPKNIILMIGDGMGFEEVRAASIYSAGKVGALSFESFPSKGEARTYSADSSVTDSAAAGTAIATGKKVNNGVISIAIPGYGDDLKTLLEYFKEKGKSTGLVTTSYLTDATPAAFGAHAENRNDLGVIEEWYVDRTQPDVLLGGGKGMDKSAAVSAGYTVIDDVAGLESLDTGKTGKVAGIFGSGTLPYESDGMGIMPHLSDLAATAINILSRDPDGFFVMIEGGLIDKGAHDHNLKRNIGETLEFSKTVEAACSWAKKHPGTLVIVTADHETGGLKVTKNNGKGKYPEVTWSASGHTGVNVPVYAYGEKAELFKGTLDNTAFYNLLTTAR
jgi:alkaline phosphatase